MNKQSHLAAVDLGSNSFRLEIGQADGRGGVRRVEYLKETVRQGNGLSETRMLSQEAMERGLECLARFGERLRGFSRGQVRAVATQTLREARNRDEFITAASKVLGFPIDVISGREEARLIYAGVSFLLPQSTEERLVIDVGGRSTELIVGAGYQTRELESYRTGSVTWSMSYFADGKLTEAHFDAAQTAAKAILDEAQSLFTVRSQATRVYGSAGTINALADIAQAEFSTSGNVLHLDHLRKLQRKLIAVGHVNKLEMPGLKEDRKPVLAGGLAIVLALFELLGITEMQVASGSLRHGLLRELLDHDHQRTDLRAHTVAMLAERFSVDRKQADRVAKVSQDLFQQIMLQSSKEHEQRLQRKLLWAAQLHEIGMQIAHAEYHKHGAYIIDNADALGFAQHELHRLSLLILGHRGKLRKLEESMNELDFVYQLISLRLAAILCHARRDPDLQSLKLTADPNQRMFNIRLSQSWSQHYPQSFFLLNQEIAAWQKSPWNLRVRVDERP
jgi:exopolyphosphatase / guanosine-5'-triphosphate,3'-diphosphate pyrophosphatase